MGIYVLALNPKKKKKISITGHNKWKRNTGKIENKQIQDSRVNLQSNLKFWIKQ